MQLRPYQEKLLADIYAAWQSGARNVLAVLPTGGGKTVTFSHVVKSHGGAAVVLAHRAELVSQMSTALAREGVRHRVVGPDVLRRLCVAAHMDALGRSWFDPNAQVAVASVQSVNAKTIDPSWAARVGLWVGDEFHHYLSDNQFGQALTFFPNARGLGVTATPGRLDGKGLGRHADGVIDVMVQGPPPCDLIAAGYLSRYKIFAPPSSLHREDLPVTASGDFSPSKLREATGKSTVTGDVVATYVQRAMGKLGLTFADSIENANIIVDKFRAAGVTAELLSGKTPDLERSQVLRKFKARKVLQIVSVALLDEGFDAPSVESVSDAAATESFGRFAQRFGRGLRILEGKEYMLYFDHVGNVKRHGLPDAPRVWSLDRRASRASAESDSIPTRVCANTNVGGVGEVCAQTYERFHRCCPFCGFYPEPVARNGPAFVEGDLHELDEATLAALRGKVLDLQATPVTPFGLDGIAAAAWRKNFLGRVNAQGELRDLIALWAGWHRELGKNDSQIMRHFYLTFGVDVLSAQALGKADTEILIPRIKEQIDHHGITAI